MERALLVQVVARPPRAAADEGAARHPGPGRERRRRRHRRRLRGRLQDGVAQPPVVHRAVPGRGDRRRRHPARRLHDGRAPDRVPQLAALRPARSPAHARSCCAASSRASAATATASACRPSAARCSSTRATTATSSSTRSRAASRAPTASSTARAERRRQPGPLRRRARPAATASTARRWRRPSSTTDERRAKRPTVQVGDPFMEKLLLEACLEIFARGLPRRHPGHGRRRAHVVVGRDGGRARATGSSSTSTRSRAARSKLTPYEMLLSESQERMLLVAKPGRETSVIEICKKWDLDAAVIGRVTDTGRWVVTATPGYDPLDDAPVAARAARRRATFRSTSLTDAAPKYDRPQRDDASLPRDRVRPSTIPAPRDRGATRAARAARLAEHRLARAGSGASTITSCAAARRAARLATPASCACRASATAATIEKLLAFARRLQRPLRASSIRTRARRWPSPRCAATSCAPAPSRIGLTDCLNFG